MTVTTSGIGWDWKMLTVGTTCGTTSAMTFPTHVLGPVLQTIRYKPGWSFEVAETFRVRLETVDSDTGKASWFVHTFPIPQLWSVEEAENFVFDCILAVERHEAAEFFRVDGDRPFMPHHFDGHDPYRIERRR